jgi:chromosome segregation ATPase
VAGILPKPFGVAARVIEALMFFALGFLVAALIALLIIPAINARAERLARRRLEALFPLSITELTAEKDHLRAEFAVTQRRLERKAEQALAGKHHDMEELGRRAVRINELENDLVARDHMLANLQRELEGTRAEMAEVEAELAAARQSGAAGQETVGALERAHRSTLDELAITRGNLESTAAALAEARTALAETQSRLADFESEDAERDQRHFTMVNELHVGRANVADLETRLASQKARSDELAQALEVQRSELADERRRAAELVQTLAGEQDQSGKLLERIRELEEERETRAAQWGRAAADTTDMRDERDALAKELEEGKSALAGTAARLAAADTRIAELEAALRQAKDGADETIRAENAELRRRIEEVAEEIMRVSAAPEEAPPLRSRSAG